jgi:hypothetical protein
MYRQAPPASAETWHVPEAKPAGSGAGEPAGSSAKLADSGVGQPAGSGAKPASFTPQAKAPPPQPLPVPEAKPAGSGAGEPAGSGARLADSGAPPDQAKEPRVEFDFFQWMYVPGTKGCPPWIIKHETSQDPYCNLCKKVATDDHLVTDKHRRG